MKKYHDISALLAQKKAMRKALSQLPVEEKARIALRLRDTGLRAPGHLAAKNKRGPLKPTWTLKPLIKKPPR